VSVEKYSGVKFKVEFLRKEPPEDESIKELSAWCRKFHSSGLTPVVEGTSMGNLSFRTKKKVEEFITTGTGLGPKNSMSPESFVKVVGCDFERGVVYASGAREPSSESMLHSRIYMKRDDVNAIFHGHCEKIVENADDLNLIQTEEHHPYGSTALIESVEEVLNGNDFIVMRGHGFLSLGWGDNSMEEAGSLALEKLKEAKS